MDWFCVHTTWAYGRSSTSDIISLNQWIALNTKKSNTAAVWHSFWCSTGPFIYESHELLPITYSSLASSLRRRKRETKEKINEKTKEPRGEFLKEPLQGVPLVWVLSSTLCYFLDFFGFPLVTHRTYWVVGGRWSLVGGAYFKMAYFHTCFWRVTNFGVWSIFTG